MLVLVYRGPGSTSLSMAMQVNNKLKRERERERDFISKTKTNKNSQSLHLYRKANVYREIYSCILCVSQNYLVSQMCQVLLYPVAVT